MVQVLLICTGPDLTLPLGDPLLVRIFTAAPFTPPGPETGGQGTGGQGTVHSAFSYLNRKNTLIYNHQYQFMNDMQSFLSQSGLLSVMQRPEWLIVPELMNPYGGHR